MEYRKRLRDGGVPAGDDDILIALHKHIADTDRAARERAADPFELYVATRLYAKRQTYDDVERSGLSLIGGTQNVRKKLGALRDMGANHIMGLVQAHKPSCPDRSAS